MSAKDSGEMDYMQLGDVRSSGCMWVCPLCPPHVRAVLHWTK